MTATRPPATAQTAARAPDTAQTAARAPDTAQTAARAPDTARLASDLRVILGQLTRRLRSEHRFSLSHGAVLGRLDREGPRSVSELATAERVRPQSMAQTVSELEADGLVTRRPDSEDRRRAVVELTDAGLAVLTADRRDREGWLAKAMAEGLSAKEQRVLSDALGLLRRLAES